MSNALKIYNGNVSSGGHDGNLVTDLNKMSLEGVRDTSAYATFAFRCNSTSYPALSVKAEIANDNENIYEISMDRNVWSKKVILPYVGADNILFFIRCRVPENYDYGVHNNVYLCCDYYGGV